jgi:hypothetical protein
MVSKSIKSIVKIRFVKSQPAFHLESPGASRIRLLFQREPPRRSSRWSQAKERGLGEFFKRDTLIFNGYADFVGSLYTSLDLKKYFKKTRRRLVSLSGLANWMTGSKTLLPQGFITWRSC